MKERGRSNTKFCFHPLADERLHLYMTLEAIRKLGL